MTTEREAMTLERVRDEMRALALTLPSAATKTDIVVRLERLEGVAKKILILTDAIDTHLRAAEPVYQHRLRIGSPNRRWFDCSKEEYEAMERNEHDRANFERRILYAHPPESARDARDAAWKDIGDGYEVSCTGRVRRGSRELIPYAKAKGYVAVSLWRGGERREEYVHRLVAGAFCDRGSGLQTQVNHRDGDKTNNYASNLEWCSPQENRIHAARVLFTDTRPVIGTCIATGEEVRFRSLAEAEEHGFIRANIQKCIAGKRKKHGGYTWRDAAMAQESGDGK